MTRPEPTLYGNCESWGFIVGKNQTSTASAMAVTVLYRGQVLLGLDPLASKTRQTLA
jgi:hypothetical protein